MTTKNHTLFLQPQKSVFVSYHLLHLPPTTGILKIADLSFDNPFLTLTNISKGRVSKLYLCYTVLYASQLRSIQLKMYFYYLSHTSCKFFTCVCV